MKKAKLFLENFLIYGLGGVISKIIPLIMVPVVTRIMPDSSYFGISDMSHTIVSFGSALAIMGMYDAMYRMFFEKDEEIYYRTTECFRERAYETDWIVTVLAKHGMVVTGIYAEDGQSAPKDDTQRILIAAQKERID